MKFVIDTNVLVSFFWANSFTRKILPTCPHGFVAPEYALEEINRHKSEIMKKAKISLKEFRSSRLDLVTFVEFIPANEYKNFLKKSAKIVPDPDDIDFAALAMKLKVPIWSNDKHFKTQSMVPVFTTKEFVELFG